MSANTGYSNGLNLTRVMDAFVGRLGWRASTQIGQPVLSAPNNVANSGRYFNDFHSLVTVPNLKTSQDDASISDADFNTYLQNLQKSAILRCINGVLNQPEQIERVLLYDRSRNQENRTIENTGLFVGFEIKTPNNDQFAVQLESITLLFDGVATFNLYLFKDGKPAPVKTKSVTTLANDPTIINLDDFVLNYIGSATKGSRFYLGYFQGDLGSVKAIREQAECWNKQLCFSAISMTSPKKTGLTDFERTNIPTTTQLFGLNLEVTTFIDHTNAVIKKAALFDELVGLQMAYMVMEQIIYSVRSNKDERILKDQLDKIGLKFDLDGAVPIEKTPKIMGLKQRIDREMERVREGFYPKQKAMSVSVCQQ